MLSSFLLRTRRRWPSWDSAGLRSSRLCRAPARSARSTGSRWTTSRSCTASRRATSAWNRTSESCISLMMSWSRSLEDGGDPVQVVQQRVDLVVLGPRCSPTAPRRRPGRRGTPRACCGSGRPGWSAPAASWSVSISSAVSARPEKASTTSYGELVRSTGISSPSSSWPLPAGSSDEEHRAEHRLDLDGRAGLRRRTAESVLIRNVDLDVVVVELDALDLADPDPGDPDLVLGLQPAGLGERGVVDVAAADQRQVLGAGTRPGCMQRGSRRC